MSRNPTTGAVLATAVALMFMATPSFAQSSSQQGQVKCAGANSCKGQSACKTASSPGPGQNSCKGQGLAMVTDAQACKDAGGKVVKE